MRRGPCRTSTEFVIAAAAAGLPSIAGAQTSGQAVFPGSPSEVKLGVNVTASVSASCTFLAAAGPRGSYRMGDINDPFSINIPFTLRCNSPSRVGIVSDNGGLEAQDVPSVPPGYAKHAAYQVTLHLAGDSGSTAQATCRSTTLIAGAHGCVFRGPATATTGLRLPGPSQDVPGSFIRVDEPGYSKPEILIASDSYADRLTVTISPAT
jgi:hypothetical protein